MKKGFLTAAVSLLAATALLSCNNASKKEARPNESFVLGEKVTNGFDYYRTYQVSFYDNNVYELLSTQITYGYSMNLGTQVVAAYGTYTNNGSEDGITTYTLNKAAEVVLSSYSKAGGFNILINTASKDQTYPTELPASGEGEKVYAQNKDDVLNAYGVGTKIYTEKNTLSFKDPNDAEGEKAVINDASGSVKSVLNKEFNQVRTTATITSANGMDYYSVYHLHTFKNGKYQFFKTSITFGYSMVLGTSVVTTFGNDEYGTSEDGYTPVTLKRADDVNLNSYSKAGGFNININTVSKDQTYPTELPASGEGEKVYAQNKEDVIDAYGEELVVFTKDTNNEMSLVNPNE